ncbi:dTDP-4-dehydrorhamnose reductase [Nocardia pseudobrasiliensis]|uniref:dTDP-4-dehydrorhamnose reductase n=1 Tax=Nocardia pseudobrasiliensis TaxID=45979 RepID=A0A370IDA0_9NOCA|nr:dTDP-4-dehydrorhamnose reductase [Nocardia pseudobrasiliensis]RDI68688.1 dTDP-4-dehydrorhamnose reductase [Nocardia pseudobrasiliensis]
MNSSFDARLIVTGAGGQLGRAVCARAPHALALHRDDLDITDPEAVRAVLRPGDVVLNCAAYAAVDAAESDEAGAFAVNETGPAVLAAACDTLGAKLIHVSTDYVFDGAGARPYETDDPTGPTSVYGRSKLAGEQAALKFERTAHIVRTAWLYTGDHGDFVATMRRLERERETVSVVDDQIGSPTFAVDLAGGLLELAARVREPMPRILHATNAGQATWFELARAVFEGIGADPARVRPCTSAEFPSPVRRPAYSVLSDRAWVEAGLTPLRDWRLALGDALARISG